MKTLIVQSYRTRDIPPWIARCLGSVSAWAAAKGYDHWLTDDSAFALCGEAYLAKVGDNKCSITNLCRLELLREAHAAGYERAIWMDADIFVFDPERLDFPPFSRILLARETWIEPVSNGWRYANSLNNCVVGARAGDPDLDLIIRAVRHRAEHHPVTHNFQVGVDVVRGLHHFLNFDLTDHVGMLSQHVITALAAGWQDAVRLQAERHGSPIHAANICASDHLTPTVSEEDARVAMDLLEGTRGHAVNQFLSRQGLTG